MKQHIVHAGVLLALGLASLGAQDHTKSTPLKLDAQSAAVNEDAAEIFLVSGKFTIQAEAENRYYEVAAQPLDDSIGLIGNSAKGSAKIQASVRGTRFARSTPRFGVGVHGQNGYRLVVIPAKKAIELWKGEEVVAAQPFTWESGAWYDLKLEVIKENDNEWSVAGRVWKKGEAEPQDAVISHKDQKLRGQGKCSLFATPYSGTPIQFDDIVVEVEESAS